jgi:hypothetical protein
LPITIQAGGQSNCRAGHSFILNISCNGQVFCSQEQQQTGLRVKSMERLDGVNEDVKQSMVVLH